jgi:hypothetical protein
MSFGKSKVFPLTPNLTPLINNAASFAVIIELNDTSPIYIVPLSA